MQTEEVIQELEADWRSRDGSGLLRYIWDRLLQRDIFAVVSRSEQLMRMHTTAEQFDPVTEYLLGTMQASCSVAQQCICWPLCCFACVTAQFMQGSTCIDVDVKYGLRSYNFAPIPSCNACLNCVGPSPQYLVAKACMAILHRLWLWLSNNGMLPTGIYPVK